MYLEYQPAFRSGSQVVSAVAVATVAGVLMERIAFRPLRGASFLALLLASFAVSVIIQSLLPALISPRQRGVPCPTSSRARSASAAVHHRLAARS